MMAFSIGDLADAIIKDTKPVLLFDTCSLLDIVRTPDRDNIVPKIISSAVDLYSKKNVWLVASEIVNTEWSDNIDTVTDGTKTAIKNLHKRVKIFKDALDHSPVSTKWLYGKAFTSFGLEDELRNLSGKLLGQLKLIEKDNDCLVRASMRVINVVAPATKGKNEYKDCMIIEHYLALCRQLRSLGFTDKIIFVSSNKTDFGTPYDIKEPLKSEFGTVQLDYVSDIAQAERAVIIS